MAKEKGKEIVRGEWQNAVAKLDRSCSLDGTILEEEKEYLDDSCGFPNVPPEPIKT